MFLISVLALLLANFLWTDAARFSIATYPGYYQERIVEYQIRKEERNCTDKPWAQCKEYVNDEFCRIFRKTLRKRCRKSCNICGNIKTCAYTEYGCCWDMQTPAKGDNGKGCPRNCHNRLGRFRCSRLRLSGYCSSDKENMERLCKGVCVCERRAARSPPSCSLSRFGCCWNGATPANEFYTNCPVCRDFLNKRICRIFRRDCFKFGGWTGLQMRKFCPRTCGVCRVFKRRIERKNAALLKKSIKQNKIKLKTKFKVNSILTKP